ncbi:MAG TPA: HEAT repeat domain-containing protein [Tepidisphaeraceae bacterium]|nr:HEAT repeat domain-containing protein [Tepidisphaeraceae bacterium]
MPSTTIRIFLLAAFCCLASGCAVNNQTEHQQQNNYTSVSATFHPGGTNQSPTNESNNNGGSIMATIGKGLASPFVYIGQQIDYASGHTPAKAVAHMEDKSNADWRRLGIIDLVSSWDYARKPPYTTRYQQIAQHDPDYTVRAMAIRALNISRDASATPIFIAALDDDNELVRLEATKALANVPDPAAVPALLRHLQGQRETLATAVGRPAASEEAKDVRIAAADALRHYRTLDVARTLVTYLNENEFGVAWQSRQSLRALTGRDLKYDQAAWLNYLTGPEKPFG